MNQQILVKISGADSPGITAAITSCVAADGGKLLDIEQAVTHGLLSLMVLTEIDGGKVSSFESNVRQALSNFHLDLKFERLQGLPLVPDPADRFVVTVIADEIPARLVA